MSTVAKSPTKAEPERKLTPNTSVGYIGSETSNTGYPHTLYAVRLNGDGIGLVSEYPASIADAPPFFVPYTLLLECAHPDYRGNPKPRSLEAAAKELIARRIETVKRRHAEAATALLSESVSARASAAAEVVKFQAEYDLLRAELDALDAAATEPASPSKHALERMAAAEESPF